MPRKERVVWEEDKCNTFKLPYEHRIKDSIPLIIIQNLHMIYGFKGSF